MREKESHVLDTDFPQIGPAAFDRHFPATDAAVRYACDVTPIYCLFSQEEVDLVARCWPDAVIVAFIRDPVARAISWVMRSRKFSYLGRQGQTKPNSLGEALALNGLSSRLQSEYDRNIARWQKAFPGQVYTILYDSVTQDPDGVFDEFISFLNLPVDVRSEVNLRRKVNVSSDITANIGPTNERALIEYWLSRPKPSYVDNVVYEEWQLAWVSRRKELCSRTSTIRVHFIRLACSIATALYRVRHWYRSRRRAMQMRQHARAS